VGGQLASGASIAAQELQESNEAAVAEFADAESPD